MTLDEMSDANEIMNPQHFGTDLNPVIPEFWINLEIWIQIPDHIWWRLELGGLAEVRVLRAQSSCVFVVQLVERLNF